LKISSLAIPDVKVITPQKFGDDRGWFSEVYSRRALAELGIDVQFVQENESFSSKSGTIRGLHLQSPPFAQDKLIRVIQGAVWDVAVDIRVGSPTYGEWVAEVIGAALGNQIFVPKGFAHGFCTLEPDTQVVYLVSNYYSRPHDAGIRWNDPVLAVGWPAEADPSSLSPKDETAPAWRDFSSPFVGHAGQW
jgi:dTDP-4-dehydrorhamnose 3,5-epimerase